MTDSLRLYTPAEVLRLAPAAREAAVGVVEAAGGDSSLLPTSNDVLARVMLLERAVAVRCTRGCDHSPRIAILDRGVSCCVRCRFQFADAKARGDGRCDTCNADRELTGVKGLLRGDMVLPTGGVQASVHVNARVCDECLALLESVPGTASAASWN